MDNVENILVDPVRGFLTRSFTSERRLAMLEANGEDAKLWSEIAELGWFSLTAPADENNGLGLDPAQLAPAFRVFGEKLLAGPMLEQMLLPGLLIAAMRESGESASPVADRVRLALTGESRIAIADPGVTEQWRTVNGTVHLDSTKLTGSLELVRFGAQADEIVVIAETGDAPVVLLLSSDRPGMTVTERESADPGSHFARVEFDGLTIDAADILSCRESSTQLVAQIRGWQRLLIACELAGISRHMLDLSLEYIQQREQFGRSIASFQAIKHMAATAAQRVILLENFCEAVADDSSTQSVADFALAAATVKANASEVARLVCEDALQMHGGTGFTYEYELHWYYKRALSLRTWYGDERELATEIGRKKLSV